MNVKRFGICIACLLVVAAFVTMAAPASASIANPVMDPIDTTVMDPLDNTQGQRVTSVRRSASYGSSDIGSFKDGTVITVLATKGDFYKVDCFDMVGYVAKSQVQVNENGEYYVNCVEGSSQTKYLPSTSMQSAIALRDAIVAEAHEQLGSRYVHGGTRPGAFDCSGLTYYLYNSNGFELSRAMLEQMAAGIVVAKEDLQAGDLVFFSNTGGGNFASHVGIYIGNGQIIHASSGRRGITTDDLSANYYVKHFQCARRLILSDLAPSVTIPATDVLQSSGWRNAN